MKIKKNIKNKIINTLIKNGKKQKSRLIFLKTNKKIQKEIKKNHIDIIKLAVINATPIIELKKIKKKKKKIKKYLPYVLNKKTRTQKAVKNIFKFLENKIPINISLSKELILTAKHNVKIKKHITDKHKEAIKKKKYIFFRWFS